MTRKGVRPEATQDLEQPKDRVGRLSDYIVRAAELILLTSAFGYAAVKVESIAAGILAGALGLITASHLATPFSHWLGKQFGFRDKKIRTRFETWSLVVGGCVVIIAASLVFVFAVVALINSLITAGL